MVDASAASDKEVLKGLQMMVVVEDQGQGEDSEAGWEGRHVAEECWRVGADNH